MSLTIICIIGRSCFFFHHFVSFHEPGALHSFPWPISAYARSLPLNTRLLFFSSCEHSFRFSLDPLQRPARHLKTSREFVWVESRHPADPQQIRSRSKVPQAKLRERSGLTISMPSGVSIPVSPATLSDVYQPGTNGRLVGSRDAGSLMTAMRERLFPVFQNVGGQCPVAPLLFRPGCQLGNK